MHATLGCFAVQFNSIQPVSACFYSRSSDDFKYELSIIGYPEIDMEEFERADK